MAVKNNIIGIFDQELFNWKCMISCGTLRLRVADRARVYDP